MRNPIALITGAGRRIGAAIAAQLHGAGYRVVIHAHHSVADVHALAHRLNQIRENSALVILGDLALSATPHALINEALTWAHRLDLLVNNASCFIATDATHFDEALWSHLFRINLQAPYTLSLAARPHLAKQQGAIINLTDIHADQPLKGYDVYCQTKAALTLQTLALAKAFAPDIRVNAVAPGAIAWPEGKNALSQALQHKIIQSTPLKQHGKPDYIAEAVLALAQNRFITGQVLKVDGGRSLG